VRPERLVCHRDRIGGQRVFAGHCGQQDQVSRDGRAAIPLLPRRDHDPGGGGKDESVAAAPAERADGRRSDTRIEASILPACLRQAPAASAFPLHTALSSRGVIGQPKGILTEWHRVTAEVAFGYLPAVAASVNMKLTISRPAPRWHW
jgi:hypothetical protein